MPEKTVCSKCGSDDVHLVEQTSVEVSIAITWATTAGIAYRVCTSCGCVELYDKDKSLLPRIAEKNPKVS